MKAFHNDPQLKEFFVKRFAAHRAADEVVQGTGFDNGRGCFVGCTLNDYSHSKFPKKLGLPEWLAHLADKIFEGIPKAEAPQFGTDLLNAINVGADLQSVKWKLAIWRHEKQLTALAENKEPYAELCRNALNQVIAYCNNQLTENFDNASARSAAESAAWSAAWSAESSAESAEESAAWLAAWQEERNQLLKFIAECK